MASSSPSPRGAKSGLADATTTSRRRTVAGVALFVLGFSVVFVAYGAAFGALGFWLVHRQDLLIRVLRVVVIALALAMVGRTPFLQRTIKPSWRPTTELAGAPVLGVVFARGGRHASDPHSAPSSHSG